MRLKKLIVKNFKSLRECEVELGKFNVLIGPNASGKTNLVEVFKLLRKIYVDHDTNPFLEWWGYNNVVWAGKEELPITVGMLFDVEGHDVYFETTFTGTGGSFRILKEIINVVDYVTLKKEGSTVQVIHSPNTLEKVSDALDKIDYVVKNVHLNEVDLIRKYLRNLRRMVVQPFEITVPDLPLGSLLVPVVPQTILINEYFENTGMGVDIIGPPENYAFVLTPLIGEDTILSEFILSFLGFLTPVLLKVLNPQNVKTPKFPRRETILSEDASNLIPLLYNIWLREGRLPEEIAEPLSIAFPNTRVFFQLTEDGRVMMKVFENELELAPPGISDGFYKVLAILTATYLTPPLLIIDEIENSLHPETLELIIDTLRESESQVIITTHSPVVVDIVEPSDLVLVDKENGETVFKRIKDPEKIKKFLNEKGITLSEGWLYGSLFENDEQ